MQINKLLVKKNKIKRSYISLLKEYGIHVPILPNYDKYMKYFTLKYRHRKFNGSASIFDYNYYILYKYCIKYYFIVKYTV
jgi:hypothetical protein